MADCDCPCHITDAFTGEVKAILEAACPCQQARPDEGHGCGYPDAPCSRCEREADPFAVRPCGHSADYYGDDCAYVPADAEPITKPLHSSPHGDYTVRPADDPRPGCVNDVVYEHDGYCGCPEDGSGWDGW